MRVLMVLGRSTGGIGTHVADLSRELRRQGADVLVATDDLTADRFALGPAGRVARWWPAPPGRAAARLAALRLGMTGADVVHAHGHQAGALAVAVARTLRRPPPVVVTWHNELPAGLAGRAIATATATGAAAVTGASSDLADAARAAGAARVWLSPVPSPKVPWLLGRPRSAPGTPLVLTVSRIAPQKDLGVVVAAAALLRERRPGLEWVVLGEGEPGLLAELEASARHTAAPVRFAGASPDVTGWLDRASVLVLTSRWEARALVAQEAMAAGVPVVARAVGGLPGLLEGCGLLVPGGTGETETAAATAGAVERLLEDPELAVRLSRRGRAVAATWPDGADTAARWLRWYGRLGPMT